jgi:hypothetical protein
LTFNTSGRFSAGISVCSLIVLSVMSARGVASRFEGEARADVGESGGFESISIEFSVGSFSVFSGSGDSEGFGVGSEGASSAILGALDILLFLILARTLCLGARFFGEAFFVGDAGAEGSSVSAGLKICEGSTDSLILVRRVLVVLLGVMVSSTVFRLVVRVVLTGAGVNSSSRSSLLTGCSSSSDSSTIFRREAAARREGRVGDALDMFWESCRVS